MAAAFASVVTAAVDVIMDLCRDAANSDFSANKSNSGVM